MYTDLILLTLLDELKEIKGKTIIQKLIYFINQYYDYKINYNPYFYGPYSIDVENSISSLKGLGYITEQVEPLGISQRGFEIKKYSYSLTNDGKEVLNYFKKIEKSEYEKTLEFTKKIKTNIDITSVNRLSVAAKTLLILQNRKDENLSNEEIKHKALSLGWQLEDNDVDDSRKFINNVCFN